MCLAAEGGGSLHTRTTGRGGTQRTHAPIPPPPVVFSTRRGGDSLHTPPPAVIIRIRCAPRRGPHTPLFRTAPERVGGRSAATPSVLACHLLLLSYTLPAKTPHLFVASHTMFLSIYIIYLFIYYYYYFLSIPPRSFSPSLLHVAHKSLSTFASSSPPPAFFLYIYIIINFYAFFILFFFLFFSPTSTDPGAMAVFSYVSQLPPPHPNRPSSSGWRTGGSLAKSLVGPASGWGLYPHTCRCRFSPALPLLSSPAHFPGLPTLRPVP